MRLWHKELIPVLPREQLIAQWRELSAIAGAILKNGTPNHRLVNFILKYPWNHFISYAFYIKEEMNRRDYKTSKAVWDKITSITNNDYNILPIDEVYSGKMDEDYLIICYYNLYEKALCGIISVEEWSKICFKILGRNFQKTDFNKRMKEYLF